MIPRVVAHELRASWRDGTTVVSWLAVLTMLALSLAVHSRRHAHAVADHARQREELRQEWLGQGESSPHSAGHFGTFVHRVPPPLAAIDPGVDPFVGSSVRIEAHVQHDFKFRAAADEGASRSFGFLSPALVLQLLAPLLVLLGAALRFGGERERGTLGLLLFSAPSPGRLVAGKALASASAILALVTPLALGGWMAADSANERAALGWMTVAYALYLGAFAGLGAWLGLASRDQSRALLGAVVLWVATCLLVPRLASEFASQRHPLPSRAEFEASVEAGHAEGIDGHNPEDARRKELESKVLAQYGVSELKDLPVNFGGIVMQAEEEHRAKVHEREFGELWSTLAAQESTVAGFSLVSPLCALRPVSMALAGTDVPAALDFARAAADYRIEFIGFLNDLEAHEIDEKKRPKRVGTETWSRVAEFEPPDRPLAERLAPNRTSLVALFAWCAAAWLAVASRLKRWTP